MGSSIRRTDLLALSNLREDGRKPHEIRRLRVTMGPLSEGGGNAGGGSAQIEMGLTMALATVTGPIACLRRSDELPDRAMLDVTVQQAPFASGGDRRVISSNDRRLIELGHLLKRALEATLLLHLYPKSRLQIHVIILAEDGGRLCAAINAASLACVDAGIPMKDLLCACAAGYAGEGTTLVDLNRREESSWGGQPAVNMPCAILPQRNSVVLSQCEARLPNVDTLERVLEAAMDGCHAVFEVLQASIRERASMLLSVRAGQGLLANGVFQSKDEVRGSEDEIME